MRFFVFILCCFFVVLPCEAYTIKGGVSYTVESARKEAFANVEYTLPQSIIDENKVDPNFSENLKLIKLGVKETQDRYIGYFSDGGYAIVYKNNLYYEYYYNPDGKIDVIGKRLSLKCPTKSYKYTPDGKLDEVVFYVSTKEAYIFTETGKLSAHWINNVGYDLNGKIFKRSY